MSIVMLAAAFALCAYAAVFNAAPKAPPRRAIVAGVRKHRVRITHRVTPRKQPETDTE